jgi:NAD(P)-dependent dehydrogenase (short-subunit alcohol dehydrogenase family)
MLLVGAAARAAVLAGRPGLAAACRPRAAVARALASSAAPDLSGRTFLITGSTDGIGLHTTRRLAAAGASVILHGRNRERLDAAAASVRRAAGEAGAAAAAGGGGGGGGEPGQQRVAALLADLSDLGEVRRLAAEARALAPGGLYTLICNAGVYGGRALRPR